MPGLCGVKQSRFRACARAGWAGCARASLAALMLAAAPAAFMSAVAWLMAARGTIAGTAADVAAAAVVVVYL